MIGTEPRTDDQLLLAARDEPEAFGEIYRRYESAVLLFFLRRTASPDLAADLTAETFAAALAALPRYKVGPSPSWAWLFGIARNVLRASQRKRRVAERARRRVGLPTLSLTDEVIERIEELDRADREARAVELLNALPAEQRDAVHARIIEEQDYDQIARTCRCSNAVARKRVSRGLSTLRAQLEDQS